MTLRTAEYVILGVLAALVAGALVYLFASYLLMSRHVDYRSGSRHVGAMLREFGYVLITQPLVPLYYVIGRRMGPGKTRGATPIVPVIFVHGYFQNRADFWWLARQLRKESLGPLYGFNYPWTESIHRNVPRLAKFVESVCAETGAQQVTLVAHSLGGLVCLEYSHTPEGERRVAHCITIGTPHGGVKWRGPILGKVGGELREDGEFLSARRDRPVAAPTLSVYSTHDNIVHPPATSEITPRGGRDVAIDDAGHLSLLYSKEAARALVDFIRAHTP